MMFHYIVIFILWLGALVHAAPPDPLDSILDHNRPHVGDSWQERWMSSTNWTGDDQILGRRSDFSFHEKRTTSPFRVFIDPGHGGKDQGAQGYYGLSEAQFALKLSKRVQFKLLRSAKLRGLHLEFMMSREGDTQLALKERYQAANAWDADVFVSIHANASTSPNARGFEVYFLSHEASDETAKRVVNKENSSDKKKEVSVVNSILADTKTSFHVRESEVFAASVFNAMTRLIRPNSRAVRQGPFTVLAGTDMPAVLIEAGYVTHPDEARVLKKDAYLNRLADAISAGIIEYYVDSNRSKELGAKTPAVARRKQ